MSFINDIISILLDNYAIILEGIRNTLLLAFFGTIVGIILGMVVALLRNQEIHYKDKQATRIIKKICTLIAKVYIDVVRGTPMMVQAMVFYYGLAYGGLNLSPLFAGFLIISFNTAAYIAEIIRSGINSLDPGQLEAAMSLGLNHRQAMVKVILPQALKNTVPALMNELIVNVKDSSVLSVIGVMELFNATKGAASQSYMYFQAYVLTAIIYLILTKSLTLLFAYGLRRYESREKKVSVPQSQTVPEVMS